jgi:hypothetical protein
MIKTVDNTHLQIQNTNSKTRIGLDLALLAAFGMTVFAQNLNVNSDNIPANEKNKKEAVKIELQKETKTEGHHDKKQENEFPRARVIDETLLREYVFDKSNIGMGGNDDYALLNPIVGTVNSNGVAKLLNSDIKKLERENLLDINDGVENSIFKSLGNRDEFKKRILNLYNIDFSKQLLGSAEMKINGEKIFIELNTMGFFIKTKSGKFISSMSDLHSRDLFKTLDAPNKNESLQQFRFENDNQAEKWAEKNYGKLLDFYKNRIQINTYDFGDNIGEICLICTKANMGDDVLYSFLLISDKGTISSHTVSYKEITGEKETEFRTFFEPRDFGIKTMLTKNENGLELSIMPYRTKNMGLVKKIKIPMQSEKI